MSDVWHSLLMMNFLSNYLHWKFLTCTIYHKSQAPEASALQGHLQAVHGRFLFVPRTFGDTGWSAQENLSHSWVVLPPICPPLLHELLAASIPHGSQLLSGDIRWDMVGDSGHSVHFAIWRGTFEGPFLRQTHRLKGEIDVTMLLATNYKRYWYLSVARDVKSGRSQTYCQLLKLLKNGTASLLHVNVDLFETSALASGNLNRTWFSY